MKKQLTIFPTLVLALLPAMSGRARAANPHPDAQWFPDAGFGFFIHWSPASVDGINIGWSMRAGQVLSTTRIADAAERARIVAQKDYNRNGIVPRSANQYWAQANRFNPSSYDPDKWLAAAKAAGFTYAVFTTRHHEGFAMWPSAHGNFNTKNFMGGRDLLRPYVEACRRQGLKVGFYYSPPDWRFDRNYLDFFWPGVRTRNPEFKAINPNLDPVTLPSRDSAHQAAYAAMIRGQVEELITQYGKIDLFWFDGKAPGLNANDVITQTRMRAVQPGMVINPRFHGSGDYVTHERTFPATRPSGWAEFCDPWTGTWSFTPGGVFRATGYELGILARAKAWRINYLLSNGPMANGDYTAVAYTKMAEMRDWMARNGESVSSSVRPLASAETASVPATSRGSVRYLFGIPRFNGAPRPENQLPPANETFTLNGVARPSRVSLLAANATLAFRHTGTTLTVSLPASVRTNLVDVVKVDLGTVGTPTPTPTGGPMPTPTPTPGGGFSGYYRLMARHSGKAVVVQGAATANGADVVQWTYGGANTNDEWQLVNLGDGHYRVVNRHSGKVLDVAQAGTANATNVQQWDWGGPNNQQWQISDLGNGYHRLTARHSGKVLNVAGAGTADGANVDQWSWANVNQQQFQIVHVP